MPAENDDLKESKDADGVSLFGKFSHDRPSDNVRLIAAYFFQQYGSEPFSIDEVKAMASEAGITIPDRVDMTLAAAQENENILLRELAEASLDRRCMAKHIWNRLTA